MWVLSDVSKYLVLTRVLLTQATPANVNPHVLRHGGDAIDHARTHGDEGDREPEKKSLLRRIWDTLERNNPYAGGASKKKKKEEEHLREGSHLQVSGPSGPPLGGGGGRGNSRNGLDGIPSHTHVGSGSGPGPGPQYYGNGGGGVNGGGGDAGGGCNCDCNCQ